MPTTRLPSRLAWTLFAGGALFFAAGPMHPKEDPADVTVKEHLRVMFDDPLWYPSHAVLLAGMAVLAVALVALARRHVFSGATQTALSVAAVATAVATPAMLLHLLSALDADAIARGDSTPLSDVQVVVETVTVPFFGFALAALAVVGAREHTLGNRWTAILGVIGGVGYGLAGATFLFTDALDPLFPAAAGIALWAMAVGAMALRAQPVAAV